MHRHRVPTRFPVTGIQTRGSGERQYSTRSAAAARQRRGRDRRLGGRAAIWPARLGDARETSSSDIVRALANEGRRPALVRMRAATPSPSILIDRAASALIVTYRDPKRGQAPPPDTERFFPVPTRC